MNLCALAVALPLLGAPLLGALGTPIQGAAANLALNALVLALTLLAFHAPGSGLIHADSLGLIFGLLTGFVSLTTAIANIGFIRDNHARMGQQSWRAYHAIWQTILASTLLGLYTDDIFLLWAGVACATIATSLAVSLPRTKPALQAAWNGLLLGGTGIALALFGTLLVYLAAQPALGPGRHAMSLTALSHAGALNGPLLNLAFVFLLLGYGSRAALAPLHFWLPEATAHTPAPLTVLNALPINVALLAILRFRRLMFTGQAMDPTPFLLTLGLASLWIAVFSLRPRRDTRRFFSASSVAHSGLTIFAFGIGGGSGVFGGMLNMLLHTLINSALLQSILRTNHLRGLHKLHAWAQGACIFALSGLPPSGLFVSEFIILLSTTQRAPLLALPLALGLVLFGIATLRPIRQLFPTSPSTTPARSALAVGLPALHLALAFLIAFAMPWFLFFTLSIIAVHLV